MKRREEHPFADSELITGAELARRLGVSKVRVGQVAKTNSGRLDSFESTGGVPMYHPVLSPRQWDEYKERHMVSTPTQGQARAGMGNLAAQAVAHLPTPIQSARPAPLPSRPLPDPALGEEVRRLATSRAQREHWSAELQALKVSEKKGELVPRALFFQKAYTLAGSIKDHLNGIPPQVAPRIAVAVEEGMIAAGLDPEQARAMVHKGRVEHVAREALRQALVSALRDLSETPLENLMGVGT